MFDWQIYFKLLNLIIPNNLFRFFFKLVTPMSGLNISTAESVHESRQRWEHGQPDFRGRDSFENILAHIESKVNEN